MAMTRYWRGVLTPYEPVTSLRSFVGLRWYRTIYGVGALQRSARLCLRLTNYELALWCSQRGSSHFLNSPLAIGGG